MATYSYVICSSCGGTSKADNACPRCQGARMVGTLVDDAMYRSFEVVEADDLVLALD